MLAFLSLVRTVRNRKYQSYYVASHNSVLEAVG